MRLEKDLNITDFTHQSRGLVDKACDGKEDEEKNICLINEQSPTELTRDNVFIRSMYLCNDQVDSYFSRFTPEALTQIAEKVVGQSVIKGHQRSELPLARFFKAETVEKNGINWVRAWFYWLRGTEGAENMKSQIDGGIFKEVSISFSLAETSCSICKKDIRKCEHIPGDYYEKALCYYNMPRISEVLEGSLVFKGAQHGTTLAGERVEDNLDDSTLVSGGYNFDVTSTFTFVESLEETAWRNKILKEYGSFEAFWKVVKEREKECSTQSDSNIIEEDVSMSVEDVNEVTVEKTSEDVEEVTVETKSVEIEEERVEKTIKEELDEQTEQFKSALEEKNVELEKRILQERAMAKQLDEQNKRLEKVEQELTEAEARERTIEINSFVETMKRAGKVTPSFEQELLDVLERAEDAMTIEVRVNDEDSSTIKVSQRSLIQEMVENMPKSVEYDEVADETDAKFYGDYTDPGEEIDARVHGLMDKKDVDYEKALSIVLKEDPELAKEYELKGK